MSAHLVTPRSVALGSFTEIGVRESLQGPLPFSERMRIFERLAEPLNNRIAALELARDAAFLEGKAESSTTGQDIGHHDHHD